MKKINKIFASLLAIPLAVSMSAAAVKAWDFSNIYTNPASALETLTKIKKDIKEMKLNGFSSLYSFYQYLIDSIEQLMSHTVEGFSPRYLDHLLRLNFNLSFLDEKYNQVGTNHEDLLFDKAKSYGLNTAKEYLAKNSITLLAAFSNSATYFWDLQGPPRDCEIQNYKEANDKMLIIIRALASKMASDLNGPGAPHSLRVYNSLKSMANSRPEDLPFGFKVPNHLFPDRIESKGPSGQRMKYQNLYNKLVDAVEGIRDKMSEIPKLKKTNPYGVPDKLTDESLDDIVAKIIKLTKYIEASFQKISAKQIAENQISSQSFSETSQNKSCETNFYTLPPKSGISKPESGETKREYAKIPHWILEPQYTRAKAFTPVKWQESSSVVVSTNPSNPERTMNTLFSMMKDAKSHCSKFHRHDSSIPNEFGAGAFGVLDLVTSDILTSITKSKEMCNKVKFRIQNLHDVCKDKDIRYKLQDSINRINRLDKNSQYSVLSTLIIVYGKLLGASDYAAGIIGRNEFFDAEVRISGDASFKTKVLEKLMIEPWVFDNPKPAMLEPISKNPYKGYLEQEITYVGWMTGFLIDVLQNQLEVKKSINSSTGQLKIQSSFPNETTASILASETLGRQLPENKLDNSILSHATIGTQTESQYNYEDKSVLSTPSFISIETQTGQNSLNADLPQELQYALPVDLVKYSKETNVKAAQNLDEISHQIDSFINCKELDLNDKAKLKKLSINFELGAQQLRNYKEEDLSSALRAFGALNHIKDFVIEVQDPTSSSVFFKYLVNHPIVTTEFQIEYERFGSLSEARMIFLNKLAADISQTPSFVMDLDRLSL